MTLLPNPHDALFKKFLSDVNIARDFLEVHLPSAIKPYCDLSTLQMAPGAFVEDNLRQHFSDILYALNIAGQKGYAYCLVEHISQAKPLTPFQLLRYQIAIIKQHLDQGYTQLPLVVTLLFYRGETSPYPYSIDILDCFEQPDLAAQVFLKPPKLIDLSIIPDEELKTHRSAALLELIQKNIHVRDVMELAHYLVEQQLYQALSTDQFRNMLYYIDECGHATDQKVFIQLLERSHVEPEYKQMMQSVANYLRNEGMQQGIEQGRLEGKLEGKLETARKMQQAGSSLDFIQKVTGLSDLDSTLLGQESN